MKSNFRDYPGKSGRVGRSGVVENTYTYTCHEETTKTLLQNFGIDVDKDQPNIHPKVYFACAAVILLRRPLSIQSVQRAP